MCIRDRGSGPRLERATCLVRHIPDLQQRTHICTLAQSRCKMYPSDADGDRSAERGVGPVGLLLAAPSDGPARVERARARSTVSPAAGPTNWTLRGAALALAHRQGTRRGFRLWLRERRLR